MEAIAKVNETKLWYFNDLEANYYKYIAHNSRVRMVLEKANKEKIKYEYALINLIKYGGRWIYFSVHLMNKENCEVAYAILDTFDMLGFSYFETPRVWGIEFLTNKNYYRYDKKEIKRMFKEGKNIYRPEEAARFNEFFKNAENHHNFIN